MSLISRIFGNDSVIETASKGVYDGVDKTFFTTEEQADHFKKLLVLYEPYKLIQRAMALIVGVPYMFIWTVSCIIYITSIFFDPCLDLCKATQLIDVSKSLAHWNNEQLSIPFSIILGFYFGGGAVEGVVRAAIERKKED